MDTASLIAKLEEHWDLDTGFFGLLREGKFDQAALSRFMQTLELVKFDDEDVINRRVVSLLWYIPIFMEWNKERVQERGGYIKAVDAAATSIMNSLTEILGVP